MGDEEIVEDCGEAIGELFGGVFGEMFGDSGNVEFGGNVEC
jgi:hypothetical protein